ncbi:unnamed protein product [Strongylus vulgaris]|uniref:Uncharacterized protein n=1 Tax=Strongylus vulgaris TaxID=40348 RepID=A0A3P7IUA1_STRVU|nr:unnamed protein product [Strongylus vulgaris]
MFRCIGNAEPTGSCDREMKGCPDDSSCFLGPFGPGLCCNKKVEEEWLDELNPECEGHMEWGEKAWKNIEYLLGRKCAHRFCPKDYVCVQKIHLAQCCQRANKTVKEP